MQTIRYLFIFLILVFAADAFAVQRFEGQLPSGAYYSIEAPDDWAVNGPLVIYHHPYSLNTPSQNVDLGPLKDLQLSQGHAVAATSYRTRGWPLLSSANDNLELFTVATQKLGNIGSVLHFGQSSGALAAIKASAELNVMGTRSKGVFSVCGMLGGAAVWDRALDTKLIYDSVCDAVPSAAFPKGDAPLTWALNTSDIPPQLGNLQSTNAIPGFEQRLEQCFGFKQNEMQRSAEQISRRNKLLDFTGFSNENDFAVQLAFSVYGLSDLVRDPAKLANKSGMQNRRVVGARGNINQPAGALAVEYCPLNSPDCASPITAIAVNNDPTAAYRLHFNSDVVQSRAKVVALGGNKDPLVPLAYLNILNQRLGAGTSAAVAAINQASSQHCEFTQNELVTGWNAMNNWQRGSSAPTPATLKNACLRNAGSENSCRFSTEAIPPLSQSTRKRLRPFNSRISGLWWNPSRSGEGIMLEELGSELGDGSDDIGRVQMTYFTYDGQLIETPPSLSGARAQNWFTGVGYVIGDGIRFVLTQDFSGPKFGNQFNSEDISVKSVGSMDFIFGHETWPTNWTESSADLKILKTPNRNYPNKLDFATELKQLTSLGASPNGPLPDSQIANYIARSGTYFNETRIGEGITLTQYVSSYVILGNQITPIVSSVLVWFTYDTQGNQMWLVGNGQPTSNRIRFDMIRTNGYLHNTEFNPAQIERLPWGSIELEFSGCNVSAMNYSAQDPLMGSGRIPMTRLTIPEATDPTLCPFL